MVEQMLRKVISGGQTGVDRAGLDAAREAGLPTGGYCAKGRLAEDGAMSEISPLSEQESQLSSIRTKKNVVFRRHTDPPLPPDALLLGQRSD
jgi:hypothetical protein